MLKNIIKLCFIVLYSTSSLLVAQTNTCGFLDDFSHHTLDEDWIIVNKNPDSRFVPHNGTLEIVASPLNGGSDLWPHPLSNFNGPRLVRPIEGDWLAEALVFLTPTSMFQSAGFVLINEEDSSSDEVSRFNEYAYHSFGDQTQMIYGANNPADRTFIENVPMYLRLKKEGITYSTWHSTDGIEWISTGSRDMETPVHYFGITSLRQPWDGDMSLYTHAVYDYVKISCLGDCEDVSATTSTTLASSASASDGTATVSPSGGIEPYEYNWNTNPPQTTATATDLSVGSYRVSVTDQNACTLVKIIYVSAVNVPEDCNDGVDNDADGLIDCEDPDCGCDPRVEICDNGIDDDNNGLIDCQDPACDPCDPPIEICDDGIDNDGDGLIDCADPDCPSFLTAVEYFFDTDPGFGQGIDVPITESEEISETFIADLSTLSQDLHTLYVRVKDCAERWSLVQQKTIFVSAGQACAGSASTTENSIEEMEYFFDNDPGFGNGHPVTIQTDTLVEQTFIADLSGLNTGLHSLYVRAKDCFGNWSLSQKHTFFAAPGPVCDSTGMNNQRITQLEYFFDNDPGFGNGYQWVINPDTTIDQTFIADLNTLSHGVHTMYVRAKDCFGFWSLNQKHVFFVSPGSSDSSNQIVRLEYYWDEDPGYGQANPVSDFSPNQEIDHTFEANVSTLTMGEHFLYVRALDTHGEWSLVARDTFQMEEDGLCIDFEANTSSTPDSTGMRVGTASVHVSGGSGNYMYQWDTDPPQTDSIATGLSAGDYTVTVMDENTDCEIERIVKVMSGDNVIPDEICDDGIDNDGDGLIDCFDPDCGSPCDTCDATGSLSMDLIAYFPFDIDGTDLSGNGNHGTPTGMPSFEAGIQNNSVLMDGDDDYFSLGNDLNLNDTFTVATWIKWQNAGHTYQNILAKYETNGFGPFAFSAKGSRINFWVSNGSNGNTNFNSNHVLVEGEWVHVIFEGSNNTGRIYINGVLDIERSIPAMTQNDDLVTIGRQALSLGSNHGDFKGNIDEMRIYNRVLNSEEKQALVDNCPIDNPSTLALTFEETQSILCHGHENGQVVFHISGGTPPYRYFDDVPILGNSDTLNNLSAGTYVVTVRDSDDNVVTDSITIEEPDMLLLEFSDIIAVSCPDATDGQISANVSGGTPDYQYEWQNGETTATATMLSAGENHVTITDANGCMQSGWTVIMADNEAPEANFSFTTDGLMVDFMNNSDGATDYFWTFDDDGSATDENPSHTYGDVGTYNVCLVVSNTCGMDTICLDVTVDEPIVVEDLVFHFGEVTGVAGELVELPVWVENFTDMSTFQMSMHLSDPAISQVEGVNNFNLSDLSDFNFSIENDTLVTVVWGDFSATGITVPDSTVLFTLQVRLAGEHEQCSTAFFDSDPLEQEVSQVGASGFPEIVEAQYHNGSVCINGLVSISGTIAKETGETVAGVTVHCSNVPDDITEVDGLYSFQDILAGENYLIAPEKDGDLNENISAFDLVQLLYHLADRRLLDSPYKHIAADLDGSMVLDIEDRDMYKDIILNNITALPNGIPSWRFVPSAYQFVDPNNPLIESFPEEIEWNDLRENATDQDFVAIKMADLTVDISDPFLAVTDRTTLEQLTFKIEDQAISKGEEITVAIQASNFKQIMLWQLGLNVQTDALEVMGFSPATLPGFDKNSSTQPITHKGLWTNLWHAPLGEMAYTANENDDLFFIKLKVLKTGWLSDFITLNQKGFEAKAYNAQQEALTIDLVFEKNTSDIEDLKLETHPNPVVNKLTLDYYLPEATKVQWMLIDINGKTVSQFETTEEQGWQQRKLELQAIPSGMYSLILRTENGQVFNRIIKM